MKKLVWMSIAITSLTASVAAADIPFFGQDPDTLMAPKYHETPPH